VFPVRYELNFYVMFIRNSVFNGLTIHSRVTQQAPDSGGRLKRSCLMFNSSPDVQECSHKFAAFRAHICMSDLMVLSIKHTTGNATGQHVTVSQCWQTSLTSLSANAVSRRTAVCVGARAHRLRTEKHGK
jgi:hypothetical protein